MAQNTPEETFIDQHGRKVARLIRQTNAAINEAISVASGGGLALPNDATVLADTHETMQPILGTDWNTFAAFAIAINAAIEADGPGFNVAEKLNPHPLS